MNDVHVSSGLSGGGQGGKVYRPPAKDTYRDDDGAVVIRKLATALRRDRLALKLPWPKYAAHMGVPLSTLYKIAQGRSTHPHELTVQAITERWEADTTGVQPGASDVVSSR
jgi:hypothetical protein